MFEQIVSFIKELYGNADFVPLHEPRFVGNEKNYVDRCIESTFVSSVGEFVTRFEKDVAQYTGSKFAVATSNGTSALHLALLLAGVQPESEVLTQPLTFIATANAIHYCGAHPVFLDVDSDTLGLSPEKLEHFLRTQTHQKADGTLINKNTQRKISACLPMHTFGHPCRIDEIIEVCNEFNLPVVEDAAEAMGSYYKNRHAGTFGLLGVLSFNGNKIITTGGGGMILTNDEALAQRAKHLSTQAKVAHPYEYIHDAVGFNYRMPNLNAALGCAQLETLNRFLDSKRDIARRYKDFFKDFPQVHFVDEPPHARSNYWLNAIIFKKKKERDRFLELSNKAGVQTRPAWRLINDLEMYRNEFVEELKNARQIASRLVNIPSSAIV
ncbi:LegC family aminotransferase [Calditrichota bacterium LG25]